MGTTAGASATAAISMATGSSSRPGTRQRTGCRRNPRRTPNTYFRPASLLSRFKAKRSASLDTRFRYPLSVSEIVGVGSRDSFRLRVRWFAGHFHDSGHGKSNQPHPHVFVRAWRLTMPSTIFEFAATA
jgi:hypothetical protein